MAQNSDKGSFKLTWRIENFSMCPQEKGEDIKSPCFVVDAWDKTTWHLRLYPKGSKSTDGDYVSCFLHRINKDDEPENVTINFIIDHITSLSKSCSVFMSKYNVQNGVGYGWNQLIALKSLSLNKDEYLPNDVLSIICYMQWGAETSKENSNKIEISAHLANNAYSLEEISTLISGVKVPTEQHLDNCIVTTRIPVERSEIKWIIKDFKTQMQTVKKISVSVETKLRKKSALLLLCYLSDDWDSDCNVMIDIQRKDKHFQQMLLKCKVSVLDQKGSSQVHLEAQHIFGENYEVWSFPPFINTRTLKNRESELLNNGAFTLQCEFAISFKGEEVTINANDLQAINHDILSNGLLKDTRNMLNDEELADVTLISEGLELPVHKFVICARSSVFKAMFTNDTEEKRTGVVHINDIDADTLMNLKSFMYGNDLPDLQPEQAEKLYLAADKYDILVLMDWCAASLKYALSVSNVCEVLVLADLHEDENLLKYVDDFLVVHSLDVLESAEWTDLMKNNTMLAANTMKKLIITLASSSSRCSQLKSSRSTLET